MNRVRLSVGSIGLWVLIALGAFTQCATVEKVPDAPTRSDEEVVIGLLSDIHYADAADRGPRRFRLSLEKLSESIAFFNERGVDMVVDLGDLTDRSPQDLKALLPILERVEAPLYHVLGNHDFARGCNVGERMEALGMPALYYAVERGGWMFLFLDTNDIATYTHPGDRNRRKELERMKSDIRAVGRGHDRNWNGGIGREQMSWLRRKLCEAGKRGSKVVVFAHHPIYPHSDSNCLNDDRIVELLTAHKCVKAYINGHLHPGNFGVKDGLPCVTLEAMVEGGDRNAYALLRLSSRGISYEGYGRALTHELGNRDF